LTAVSSKSKICLASYSLD